MSFVFPVSDQEQRDDPAATLAVGIGLYVLTDLFERLDNFIEPGCPWAWCSLLIVKCRL